MIRLRMNIKQAFGMGVGLAMVLGAACPARAAFSGPFALSNWTLINSNANGSIDLSAAPDGIRVTGGNNGSVYAGLTEWTMTVPAATTIQFDWIYATDDDTSGPWDRAGWRRNGVFTELARNDSTNLHGRVTANVSAGDTLSFWVKTEDNLVAPGKLSITNFTFSSIPRFVSASLNGETVSVQFETIPGKTYCIMGASEVFASDWVQVGATVTAVSALTTVVVGPNTSPRKFFRAALLP
jgi:hypothetical protein